MPYPVMGAGGRTYPVFHVVGGVAVNWAIYDWQHTRYCSDLHSDVDLGFLL